ncbi:sushi, von Willebrand factor type A, EGF and pentraxin domain-containing protein 1-like [Gigantopelta aegis]|uniref:sushi, von Willebrand factor type A, EGF and pentraxin domain-containing protein 1-like n=1 Tax=Gigantopelta aegis TaxID=1735272 RepID=UPI001B88BB37|nr:sushi, von Willebrand factor type A, EGF and pentraxin domain-containing protein 1-like [Gigantopelta aegis]
MMEIYHTLTWIFGALLLVAKVSPERSHQLIGSEFVTETVHNYLQCQSLCDRRSLCKSVKYNTRTRECTPNYRDVKSSNMPLAPVESWVIFEDKSAKQVGRVCRSKPCAGNQVCVQLGSKGNCLTEDIDCGEPPVVPNVIRSKNGTKFNSVAKYSCDVGYVMSYGTMTSSTCESTGKWTSVNMTCTDIDCGEPPVVPNVTKSKNGTKFNSVAKYSCDFGYVMRISQEISQIIVPAIVPTKDFNG